MDNCVFCEKFKGEPADVNVLSFTPLDPVTPGHVLVVPRKHVADYTTDPGTTADVMRTAAMIAKRYPGSNLITSKGEVATQSVFHLHVHIVPRRHDDGLALPWTGQKKEIAPTPSRVKYLKSYDSPRQVRVKLDGREYSIVNMVIPPLERHGERAGGRYTDLMWEFYGPNIYELFDQADHLVVGRFASVDEAIKHLEGTR